MRRLYRVFCRSRRQRNRRTLAADVWYRDHQNGTKYGELIYGALLYVTTQISDLWPNESTWNAKIMKDVKTCNAFLVHRLAERDEIWQC